MYEQSLQDDLEGQEIYVDPQLFRTTASELAPEYDDNEEIDYGLADEDNASKTINATCKL